jgi:hypothetical protein
MPDETIDIKCTVQLPNSDGRVFIQLFESRPERVFYRITLKDPQGNIAQVVPADTYKIPIRHDLGRGANDLRGYQMACVGVVGFVVDGNWQVKCETIVDGVVVNTCGPGELNGKQGDMSKFRFLCTFV